jgi:hypothetical protein
MKIRRTKEIEQLLEAFEYGAAKRGKIIDAAIMIENVLTDIITWCFYPAHYESDRRISNLLDENGVALKSLLLRKIDFRDKIEILKDVILNKKPHVAKSNEALINTIAKELNQVRVFRNLLAHSESDLSREFLNSFNYTNSESLDKFRVIECKKGKIVKHLIDKAKYLSETKIMVRVLMRLEQLFALLNDDSNNASKYGEFASLIT